MTQNKIIKDELFLTFKEWNARNVYIKKGEKATWFDGVPKFSKNQTVLKKINFERNNSNRHDEFSDEIYYGSVFDEFSICE
jgi:hypothetical protein